MIAQDMLPVEEVRKTHTSKRLTSSQFDELHLMVQILDREIRRSGTFKEKLLDLAHDHARSHKYDPVQAETMLRDLYAATYSITLNQRLTSLMEGEKEMGAQLREKALEAANTVPSRIKDGDTLPAYRAIDDGAVDLANDLKITERTAKRAMFDSYEQATGNDLYRVAKDLEEEHHVPVREKERLQRRLAERKEQRAAQPVRVQSR
ncbi:hypothetical protein [uncultured Hoeflea sp.]|uniref:hypothetical protein n=1 Tax=uncultured Hoeflea sp. TaxID=538666 RepID=UPI0026031614|nr:hypothetical protein [uncultured Hoeflea sp.]